MDEQEQPWIACQTQLAFHENLLEELNAVVTQQQQYIMQMERQLQALKQQLQSIHNQQQTLSGQIERPPHY